MASLDWAPPLPPSSAPPSAAATPAPDAAPSFLDSPSGELALFRALVAHRLVGPTKHWDMVGVLLNLRAHASAGETRGLTAEDVWRKYRELYDEEVLERVWEEQQEQLLPTPSPSPAPENAGSPSLDAAGPSAPAVAAVVSTARGNLRASPALSAASNAAKARIHASFFPFKEFTLVPLSTHPPPHLTLSAAEAVLANPLAVASEQEEQEEQEETGPSLTTLSHERGRLPPSAPRESPVPDDAPLREVSVPLPEPEVGKTSPAGKRKGGRKRGAPTVPKDSARGSPRKRQKREDGAGGDEDESELSDLDSELSDPDEDASGDEGVPLATVTPKAATPKRGARKAVKPPIKEDDDEDEEMEEGQDVSLSEADGSEGEEGVEGDEGDSDSESAVTAREGSAGPSSEAGDGKKGKKDKAAAIRALPSSKRKKTPARGRSASATPSEATTSATATPPKKGRRDSASEKKPPATATRTSGRKGAGQKRR
ncbi:hypothetical protein JCM10213_000754 [Rhodosporidiobolus nylandii]